MSIVPYHTRDREIVLYVIAAAVAVAVANCCCYRRLPLR